LIYDLFKRKIVVVKYEEDHQTTIIIFSIQNNN